MTTLLFLATALILLISLLVIVSRFVQKKKSTKMIKVFSVTLGIYLALWCTFYYMKRDVQIELTENTCFDDWCATITKAELLDSLRNEKKVFYPKGKFVVLHIKLSNHARRISQKPSEPRVLIVADGMEIKSTSNEFEILKDCRGPQIPLDSKLELGQSLETQMLFDVSKTNTSKMWATIDEGPFITKMLLPDDRKVFRIR